MKLFLIKSSLVIAAFFLIARFCEERTGTFRYQSVLSDRAPRAEWTIPLPSPAELDAINVKLNQPFYFLNKGGQCFVFLGEDNTTILKLFKHNNTYFKKGRLKLIRPNLNPIFSSHKVAYDHLKEESSLLYIHLNRTTGLHPSIQLHDKIGNKYAIDLDKTEFILQKKGELLCSRLRALMDQDLVQDAKLALDHVFTTLRTQHAKGVRDHDPALRRNFGFVDSRATILDVGSLTLDPNVTKPEVAKLELQRKLENLDNWLAKHYPELHAHFKKRLNN